MIRRILILLLAFQLVVTSSFAHVIAMPEHCAAPVVQHAHCGEDTAHQDHAEPQPPLEEAAAPGAEEHSEPLGLLHCGASACTDQFGLAMAVALSSDLRRLDLSPAEPPMALQSVLLSHLRPPSA